MAFLRTSPPVYNPLCSCWLPVQWSHSHPSHLHSLKFRADLAQTSRVGDIFSCAFLLLERDLNKGSMTLADLLDCRSLAQTQLDEVLLTFSSLKFVHVCCPI